MSFPSPARDYHDKPINLNELLISNSSATYFMKVSTDALESAHIVPGSIVIIDRSLTAKHDSIIVATLNGELYLRRLIITGQGNFLSADKKYAAIKIETESDFEVWGVVRAVIGDPNNLLDVRFS